jgi:RNA recognition motif. (a.k.a. RRM, RBD, or RNP domain)
LDLATIIILICPWPCWIWNYHAFWLLTIDVCESTVSILFVGEMSSHVYIGRLPDSTRNQDVECFFKGYGRIREIRLNKGFGFVVRTLVIRCPYINIMALSCTWCCTVGLDLLFLKMIRCSWLQKSSHVFLYQWVSSISALKNETAYYSGEQMKKMRCLVGF